MIIAFARTLFLWLLLASGAQADLLALPDSLSGWVTKQPLEPIYLREPVAAK